MPRIFASRYHDFSYGHRVVGHEGKCACLHGHNGRVTFEVEAVAGLDAVGRVLDFSVIKSRLCQWLEENWDHRMLIWSEDPMLHTLRLLDPTVVVVPFNPTSENMADHLLREVAPAALFGIGAECVVVQFEETRKCGAIAVLTAEETRASRFAARAEEAENAR